MHIPLLSKSMPNFSTNCSEQMQSTMENVAVGYLRRNTYSMDDVRPSGSTPTMAAGQVCLRVHVTALKA